MRLLDLREYGAGVHKVPVLLHIKQLITELTLTEDRPASGAVKCQNINIILPALDRIVAPPFAHLEGDKGKLSRFSHANLVLLTDSLKHSIHQIGQIGCNLLGRILLAKQLVIPETPICSSPLFEIIKLLHLGVAGRSVTCPIKSHTPAGQQRRKSSTR